MHDSITYSFPAYLAAKKSVDNRALNRHVWQNPVNALPSVAPETPLRVLDVGAGTGVMLEGMLEWKLLTGASYTHQHDLYSAARTSAVRFRTLFALD